jgi:cytochrome c biogenesis protein
VVLHVNSFNIEYRSDGSEKQFYSDLSIQDFDGRELSRKTISVNSPLRYGGMTIYQTDWSMAAITLRARESPMQPADGSSFNLPMATLEGRPGESAPSVAVLTGGCSLSPFQLWLCLRETQDNWLRGSLHVDAVHCEVGWKLCVVGSAESLCCRAHTGTSGRLWATFLPTERPQEGRVPRGISILSRDMQSVVLYDSAGKFAGVRRPGSGKPIVVDGQELIIDNIVGSTGMELKSDPGVPFVYAGFAGGSRRSTRMQPLGDWAQMKQFCKMARQFDALLCHGLVCLGFKAAPSAGLVTP